MVAYALGVLSGMVLFVILRGSVRTPASGHVLICRSQRGVDVERSPRFVWPVFERAEEMAVHESPLVVERIGRHGVSLSDGVRVDVRLVAMIAVGERDEDVLSVAEAAGASRALAVETLEARFGACVSTALDDVIGARELEGAIEARTEVEDEVRRALGEEHGGYRVASVAIERWTITPADALDPAHPDDVRGLAKLSAREDERRRLEAEAAKKIALFELEAARATADAELEAARARADAEREIAIAKAKADAEVAAARAALETAALER